MPIRFYSDALGKVIEPKYEAIPSKTVDELMEELMEELITKKYIGTIYTPECEEKESGR